MADVNSKRENDHPYATIISADRIALPVLFLWLVIAAVCQTFAVSVAAAMSLGVIVCLTLITLLRLVLLVRSRGQSPTTRLLGYAAPFVVGVTALTIWLTRQLR